MISLYTDLKYEPNLPSFTHLMQLAGRLLVISTVLVPGMQLGALPCATLCLPTGYVGLRINPATMTTNRMPPAYCKYVSVAVVIDDIPLQWNNISMSAPPPQVYHVNGELELFTCFIAYHKT